MDRGTLWAAVHGVAESDTTEWLPFHFSLSCIGEGNGNPLQCSCLENPRDRGAWWTAVYGVTQSQTRLKWLSSSSRRGLWDYPQFFPFFFYFILFFKTYFHHVIFQHIDSFSASDILLLIPSIVNFSNCVVFLYVYSLILLCLCWFMLAFSPF